MGIISNRLIYRIVFLKVGNQNFSNKIQPFKMVLMVEEVEASVNICIIRSKFKKKAKTKMIRQKGSQRMSFLNSCFKILSLRMFMTGILIKKIIFLRTFSDLIPKMMLMFLKARFFQPISITKDMINIQDGSLQV